MYLDGLETRLKWFRRRLDLPGMYSEWPGDKAEMV